MTGLSFVRRVPGSSDTAIDGSTEVPMSVQQAKDFLVQAHTDTATADKVREARDAALVSLAQEEGFDISAQDLQAAMSEAAVLDDLAVADVDDVVGGVPMYYDSVMR